MTIWRAIYLNSIDELDTSNFGCHWTKDEFYANSIDYMYNDISEQGRKGNIQYLFKTEIEKNQIDELNTEKSNNEYTTERECVLKINTVLEKVQLIYPKEYARIISVNTGIRKDKWIK